VVWISVHRSPSVVGIEGVETLDPVGIGLKMQRLIEWLKSGKP